MDSVHLQGIGKFRAKKIKDFQVGEKMVFNYGSVYTIKKIKPSGKSSLEMTMEHQGKEYTTKYRKETLRGWHL